VLAFGLTAAIAGCAAPSGSPAPSSSASQALPLATFQTAAATSSTSPTSGPSLPAELDPSPVEVVDSGFTPDDQGGSATYGALLHNPNTSWAAVRMEVHVDFLGRDGSFIAGEEPIVTILPGQTTAIGGHAFGAGEAASMEVVPPDDIVAFGPRPADEGAFTVEDVQTTSRGDLTITTGRLVSTFPTEQTFVQVSAIYRDGAGAIVGGAGGGVQSIPPDRSAAFEIVEATPSVEIASTEIYWQVTR
jgi:hypothetical protein